MKKTRQVSTEVSNDYGIQYTGRCMHAVCIRWNFAAGTCSNNMLVQFQIRASIHCTHQRVPRASLPPLSPTSPTLGGSRKARGRSFSFLDRVHDTAVFDARGAPISCPASSLARCVAALFLMHSVVSWCGLLTALDLAQDFLQRKVSITSAKEDSARREVLRSTDFILWNAVVVLYTMLNLGDSGSWNSAATHYLYDTKRHTSGHIVLEVHYTAVLSSL